MIDRRLFNVILAIVTAMWVANLLLPTFLVAYNPSPAVNGIFGVIVGGAMAGSYRFPRKDEPPKAGDQ